MHGPHGCHFKLLDLLGGATIQMRNADSWEGWYWGTKHFWGGEPFGLMPNPTNLYPGHLPEHAISCCSGAATPSPPPEASTVVTTSAGSASSGGEIGIKQIYVCPDLNYGAAVFADKWIPILPNTDAALQLAIAYQWITEDTYDKDYVATHTVGFEAFRDYVLGKEDGVPKTPEWAAEKTAVPSRIIKALARAWATKRTTVRARFRRALHPRTLTPTSRPGWRRRCWPCRVWASRGSTPSASSTGRCSAPRTIRPSRRLPGASSTTPP